MKIDNSTTIDEHKKCGRWIIFLSRSFEIDNTNRQITLDRFNLEDSLQQLVAWSEEPGKKRHGRYHLFDLTPKQRKLCSSMLNNKFVEVR